MNRYIAFLLLFLVSVLPSLAQDTILRPEVKAEPSVPVPDSALSEKPSSPSPHGRQLKTPFLNRLYQWVKTFSSVDTAYIEPQKYNYAVMLQNTNTFEFYELQSKQDQRITFSPKPSFKVGPYFGWRWIFLGYTIDLSHLGDGGKKQDWNISLYSSQIGVDLFYRKNGDYRVHRMDLGKDINTKAMRDAEFDGMETSIKGFNLYYIFNHRKFSYPAAYSQSTIQRRSVGSPMVGIGYTHHSLDFDWQQLRDLMDERTGSTAASKDLGESLVASKVNYTDLSFSGGYAYNWVFARNWLFDISMMGAVAYKKSKSDTEKSGLLSFKFMDFKFNNFNMDGIFRAGIVWNNMRWFWGANTIAHIYNYRKSQFGSNNVFGSVNIYFGYNFGKR